jgi:hypothetical protein
MTMESFMMTEGTASFGSLVKEPTWGVDKHRPPGSGHPDHLFHFVTLSVGALFAFMMQY